MVGWCFKLFLLEAQITEGPGILAMLLNDFYSRTVNRLTLKSVQNSFDALTYIWQCE